VLEHLGFEIPLSTVAAVTRQHAAQIAHRQQVACENANVLQACAGTEQLIAEADGSFIRIVSTEQAEEVDARKTRTVDYKEARLVACAEQGTEQSAFYDATFGPVDSCGLLWAQAAKSAGMSLDSKVHVVADGAAWIDSQRSVAFAGQSDLLIDLYHVMEYLAEASETCSDKPKQWLKTQKRRLKAGHSKKVIAELNKHRESEDQADESAPVRRAWRYLSNRSEHLAYDEAIERDLPIGSGLIESANKHVIQARMKIPGASWNIHTAENFARARAMRANKQWRKYWEECKNAA